MSYKKDIRNTLGKLITKLILQHGIKSVKSGTLQYKVQTGDDNTVETIYYDGGSRHEVHTKLINVIFTPNYKHAYHLAFILDDIFEKIKELCLLLNVNFQHHQLSHLIDFYINIDGDLIKIERYRQYPPKFFVPDEMKEKIASCSFKKLKPEIITTSNKNILRYEFDKKIRFITTESSTDSIELTFSFGIKNITINGESVPFNVMKESGLISALIDDYEYEGGPQVFEECAYTEVSEDIDFSNHNYYFNLFSVLRYVDGISVGSFTASGSEQTNEVVDKIAKERGW